MDLLDAVIQIESNWNAKAENKKSGARGLGQITKIALKDYNNLNKEKYTFDDMYNPQKNIRVTDWYLNERIPKMLKAYKIPATLENTLASYNFGIGNLKTGKNLPPETVDYINKIKKVYKDNLKKNEAMEILGVKNGNIRKP